MKITAYLIVFVLFICGCENPERANKAVDDIFSEFNENTPGCALGIIKEGKLIYAKGYGMADLEHDIPITPTTVFYTGSVSKQFVTTCVMLLVEQGKINLDAEIQKYLPDFPVYDAPLTVRHFIHHTSGVRDYLALWSLTGGDYLNHIDEDAVYRLIKRQKELNFSPGEKYLYSNSCYFMLAMIVERVSGQSFRDFAQANIFDPLEMRNSHFHDNYLHLIKNRAFSYAPGYDNFDNLIMRFDLVGSGGMYATIEDMARWDRNFYQNKLGKKDPEFISRLQVEGTLNNGERTGYAFALVNDEYRGLKTVGHGGALAGYRAQFLRFPEQDLSIILLGNVSNFDANGVAQKVADVYLDHLMEPVGNKPEAQGNSRKENPNAYILENPEEYTGTYYSGELDVSYNVFSKNDTLYYQVKFNDPVPLIPLGKDTFENMLKLTFTRDMENDLMGFTLNAGRVQNLSFQKVTTSGL